MPTKSITNADPIQEVLSRLRKVKPTGESSWEASCPSHDDGSPSLSVSRGEDGRVLVCCHAGCATCDIVADLGLTLADLFVRNGSPKPAKSKTTYPTREAATSTAVRLVENGTYADQWDYHNRDRSLAFVVIRVNQPDDEKEFRPIHPTADGWVIGAPTGPYQLFGITTLAQAAAVIVVEGERCVEAARTLGFIATTSAFGSKSAAKSDWSELAGKQVCILPDNDGPGRAYAKTVAKILTGLQPPARVKIVELPGLPEHGDIVDFVDERDSVETADIVRGIDSLIDAAPWFVPSVDTEKPKAKARPVADALEWQPFPVDALPKEIAEIVVTVAKAIGVDCSMITLPLLAVFATTIGNSRRIRLKHSWFEGAILWAVLVVQSGEIKTPAIKVAGDILYRRYKRALKEYQATVTAFNARLAEHKADKAAKGDNAKPFHEEKPKLARCVVSDVTIEALACILEENWRGVCVICDELAGWFSSFDKYRTKGRGGDLAAWESMHSGCPLIVDRKGGSGTPRQQLFVPRASVSITGGIQPRTLKRTVTPEFLESGLIARCLFAIPPVKLRQWTNADVPEDVETRLDAIADRLFGLAPEWDRDGEPKPRIVKLTDEAHQLFVSFYNEHNKGRQELGDDLKAAFSKKEAYAARLALVLSLVAWAAGESVDPDFVNAANMANAIRLVRWFSNEDRRVYEMLFAGCENREQAELVELIEDNGGRITARELQRRSRAYRLPGGAEKAEAALQELVAAGTGEWTTDTHGGGSGPAKRVFLLGGGDRFA